MLYTHPIHIPCLICYGAGKGVECYLVRHLLLNDVILLTALTGRSASVSRLQLVSVMSYGRSLRVLLVYKTQGHDFFGSKYWVLEYILGIGRLTCPRQHTIGVTVQSYDPSGVFLSIRSSADRFVHQVLHLQALAT